MNESSSSRRAVVGVFIALLVGLAAVVFLWPRIEEARSPQPRAAYVAIKPVGSSVAVVGSVEIPEATDFELHAVIEAQMPDDSVAYLTDAPALVIHGQRVDPGSILPLELRKTNKILWFTVEGAFPYLKLERDSEGRWSGLERFRFQEFLHPEWGLTSSLRGSIESHYEARIAEDLDYTRRFGIQRFQIWVEIFPSTDAPIPELRLKSAGPERVEALGQEFPTVVLKSSGPLGAAQQVFGLTQVATPSDSETPDPELLKRLTEMAGESLLFTRATVLRAMLSSAEVTYDELDWRLVDFGEASFSPGLPLPGDLLRSGARVVVLLEDSGTAGVLDGADLCLDFEDGATIRPLEGVFLGEGGSVEWVSLVASDVDSPSSQKNGDSP